MTQETLGGLDRLVAVRTDRLVAVRPGAVPDAEVS